MPVWIHATTYYVGIVLDTDVQLILFILEYNNTDFEENDDTDKYFLPLTDCSYRHRKGSRWSLLELHFNLLKISLYHYVKQSKHDAKRGFYITSARDLEVIESIIIPTKFWVFNRAKQKIRRISTPAPRLDLIAPVTFPYSIICFE